ncbi:MAG: 2-iminobutanoate/2-iminopropanoate deaminase [Hyphomicrobiales bacterium]|jgi:2-iminobutanoate/2-iminopropanoate deaminase
MKKFALVLTAILFAAGPAGAAEYLDKTDMQKARAFSPAVVSEGGRTVYLAGQTTLTDENGANIAGNFEAQARTIFRLLDKTLQRAGGSLKNMVTMTVFITDVRNGDRFVEIRKETFPDGNFPASALITVSALARPGMLIEIQGIGMVGDACSNEKPCTKK